MLDRFDHDDGVVDHNPDGQGRPRKREMLLIEKPKADMAAKVPINETGIAISGMSAARQVWRKIRTTRTTRAIASKSVFALHESTRARKPSGRRQWCNRARAGSAASSSSIFLRTAAEVASAFEPGSW